ncbi:MAG: phosphodiester glycosidase family protein [Actinomycetota bacterium]|nr:phosphodiester glycosidase family protein [Actinomycetota bacterium]
MARRSRLLVPVRRLPPPTHHGRRYDGGKILLVAIDGRWFDYSVGASFKEEAGVMRALGAVGAVNLDGGASTTLVIDGELVNRPSDVTGEQPIGDALLLFD